MEREVILQGLQNKFSLTKIAKTLNRSVTTISNELKGQSQIIRKGTAFRAFNECLHRKGCDKSTTCNLKPFCPKQKCTSCSQCHSNCDKFEKDVCPQLSHPPYVCNQCSQRSHCSLEKKLYNPLFAQKEVERNRSECRSGLSYDPNELQRINDCIKPLVQKGQSLYHIHNHHKDELMISLQTLYNLVHACVLDVRALDLPKAVKYRPRKSVKPLKVDRLCHQGRGYKEFLDYTQRHPHLEIVEMDTVESIKGGKVLLTLLFRKSGFLLAYIREANTAASVEEVFNQLKKDLGLELFTQLFPILLTDRGAEFTNPTAIEEHWTNSSGEVFTTKVFYCDPRHPEQKGTLENTHKLIRMILPKGTSIETLAQKDIQLGVDQINSYSRKNLNDRCPYQLFKFFQSSEILQKLSCSEIHPSHINLTPSLFTK